MTFFEIYQWRSGMETNVLRTDQFDAFAKEVARIAKTQNRGRVLVSSREVDLPEGGIPKKL